MMHGSRAGRVLLGLALLLGLTRFGSAAELPAGITEVRVVGGITEYQLDNGLQLLLMPVASHPSTLVSITYRVGSRHEGAGEAGMAHLLEHVTFRGTASFDDLGSALQQQMVRFNGTTSFDRTNYIDSFAPGEAGLQQVLRLEASRMHEALLRPADFAKEKPIVLNEMGLRGGGTGLQLLHALNAGAFRQHPYGRPVIGFTADIENLSLPTLRAFYTRHYRPDNAVLLVAGAFDPAQALAAVAASFGPLPRPAEPLSPLELSEPVQQGPREMTLRTQETALAVAYRTPGMAHPQAPGLVVLSQLLPRVQSRLSKDNARPVQFSMISAGPRTRDPYLVGVLAQLPTIASDNAEAREALATIERQWLNQLERIGQQRGGETLARQLAQSGAAQLDKGLQEPAAAAALIADAVGAGDWRLPFKLRDGLQALPPATVFELARSYVREENRVLVRGVTDPAVRASEFKESPLTGLAGLFSKPVEVPVVKDASADIGELKAAEPASGGGAASAVAAEALAGAVHRYQLPGGLLLAELPRPSSGEQVSFHLLLRWGRPAEMATLNGWRVLGSLLEDGAAGRSAAEIRQLKLKLQADFRVLSGPQQVYVTVTAKKSTLVPALVLLKELLSGPTLAEEGLRRERGRMLAQLESTRRSPAFPAMEQQRQHLNQQRGLQAGAPAYQPSVDELMQIWRQLTLDELRDFHRRYWSANEVRAAVVGQIPEQFRDYLEAIFGGWKKPETPPYVREVAEYRPLAAARFVATGSESGAAVVTLLQALPLNRHAEDYAALLIGSRILAGGGISGTRLADRLRAQDALSYSVNAQLSVPGAGNRASLRLQASGAPASATRVEALMHEEIARVLAEGFTADEVERARQQIRTEQRQQLGNDSQLAGLLINQFDRQIGFDALLEDEERLQAVTPARALEVMRRLLRPDGWVTTVTGALPGTL